MLNIPAKYLKIQANAFLLLSSKHANLVRARRCDIKRKQFHNLWLEARQVYDNHMYNTILEKNGNVTDQR